MGISLVNFHRLDEAVEILNLFGVLMELMRYNNFYSNKTEKLLLDPNSILADRDVTYSILDGLCFI